MTKTAKKLKKVTRKLKSKKKSAEARKARKMAARALARKHVRAIKWRDTEGDSDYA